MLRARKKTINKKEKKKRIKQNNIKICMYIKYNKKGGRRDNGEKTKDTTNVGNSVNKHTWLKGEGGAYCTTKHYRLAGQTRSISSLSSRRGIFHSSCYLRFD